jgi:hypothetical protein
MSEKRNAQRRAARARAREAITPDAPWHGTSSGYTNHCCRCEDCRSAYRAYVNVWRKQEHVAERIRARARELAKRPDQILRKKARQYGLDAEQLGEYLAEGVCFACGAENPEGGLSIDHDHTCCPSFRKVCGDCVRGLLCRSCNVVLGQVGDDPERWEAKRASQPA